MGFSREGAVARLFGEDLPGPLPAALFVVAHPDDEVIGASCRLLPLAETAALVCVTDGSPANMEDARRSGFATRAEYAEIRRREMNRALSMAGIFREQVIHLEIPDQEASRKLPLLARRLALLLRRMRPDVVVTHPYEGGHPDHDATAFAVHNAVRLLEAGGFQPPPVAEMTSYHNRGGQIHPFDFLPDESCAVTTVFLDDEQRQRKRAMLDCYRTQRETLAWFPVEVERFRSAPAYDFTRPPHSGVLFYEMFDWGMTGERWRELAAEALQELDPGVPQWR